MPCNHTHTHTHITAHHLQLDRSKIIGMAQDIARAIGYLHSRKPMVVCGLPGHGLVI